MNEELLALVPQDNKEVEKFKEESTKFIPALGVLNEKNRVLKEHPNATGEFYDYGFKKPLGKELIMCALTYRFKYAAYTPKGVFVEQMYVARQDSDFVYENAPEVKAFRERNAANSISQSLDLLVFLPTQNVFRHFNVKGMLDEGGIALIENSISNGRFVPCRCTAIQDGDGANKTWIVLQVEPLMGKTLEFPNSSKTTLELFNKTKEVIEDDPVISSSRVR